MTRIPAHMIDAAIRDRGHSNMALARALDVRPNVVSMWRTGGLPIPAQRAVAIARVTGVDPVDFVQACIFSYPENGPWQAFAAGFALSGEILGSRPRAARYNTQSSHETA